MLKEMIFRNFKCFERPENIPIGSINLLTGINGRGKSTTLQALLLMRQSPEHSRTTHQLIFNGSCVELGSFNDVKNSNTSRNESINLTFKFENEAGLIELAYAFSEDIDDNMVANIKSLNIKLPSKEVFIEKKESKYSLIYDNQEIIHQWYDLLIDESSNGFDLVFNSLKSISFKKIHYVSADRVGPQDYYPKKSFTDFPNVGRRGEYTANVLSKMKNVLVNKRLCLESGETHTILDQTSAWISKVFEGGKINVRSPEANIVFLELNSENSIGLYKPVNVGFGYSYALPIIVSGLIANKGDILIVENPEAHLHPYAQSQLIQFLSKVSACGVQVFIESHSDHILNGLRLAVLDKIIDTNDLNILFFDRSKESRLTKITVDDNGAINDWPNGFFDQNDKDFKRLFGF